MASTKTTTASFGAFTYQTPASQRMRSTLLIPTGPAFRPRTALAPIRTQTRPIVVVDDRSDSESDCGSESDVGSEFSPSVASTRSVWTPATSVESLCLDSKPVSVPAPKRTTHKAPAVYLYEGGRTNVVSGGVMLGGAVSKPQPTTLAPAPAPAPAAKPRFMTKPQAQQKQAKPALDKRTAGCWRNFKPAQAPTTGSWRRAAPVA